MTATNSITNSEDILDSRDVIARIDTLVDDEDRTDEESAELKTLLELQTEATDSSEDWPHGALLIRDDHFQDYAQEFADEIGAVPDNAGWPNTCIDWEWAARELQHDYTSVEFDGVTYWVR